MNNRIKDIVNNADIEYQNWILNNSYKDCHIKGLHSIAINSNDGYLSRVFITDDNHELTKDAIAVHSHRYSLGITVLKGYIHHRLYFPTKDVFPYNDAIRLQSFRYHSKLNENKGCFSKYGGSMLFDTNLSVLHPNSYIYLKSSDLHDVYCLQQVNAWLCVEGKDNYSYNNIVYSNKDLTQWSDEGYYNKFEAFDEIKHYINML